MSAVPYWHDYLPRGKFDDTHGEYPEETEANVVGRLPP